MRRMLWLAGALFLAGCQQPEQQTAANGSEESSGASAAEANGAAIQFEPGQWQMVTRITSVDMPGMPADAAKMMTGRTNSVSHCMTEEQAKSAPGELLMKSTGGRLDAAMTCKNEQGGQSKVRMSGDYAPTQYSATSQVTVTVPGAEPMTMNAEVSGKRVGECQG